MSNELDLKVKKLELYEEKLRLKRGLPHIYGHKFYKWQHDYFHDYDHNHYFLCAANQIGKANSVRQLIPTPNGMVRMGDLSVGDSVYTQDGSSTEITSIPYRGIRPMYRITFDDGSYSECSQEHLWKVQTEKNRFRPFYTTNWSRQKTKRQIPNTDYGKWQVLETQELIGLCGYEGGKTPRAGKKAVIPVCEPVQYQEKELPVDPYVMGAMIGDGCLSRMCILSSDKGIIDRMPSITKDKGEYYHATLNNLRSEFVEMGLMCKSLHKFIPVIYMQASVEQRLELLKGLMDTDGSIYGKNTLEYCTISEQLMDDFTELVNSLGGVLNKATRKKAWYYNEDRERVYCNDAYSIRFKMQLNPFWLDRKASKWRKDIRYKHQRIIEKIEYVGEEECQCISVDGGLYLVGKEYIVTHNSSIQIRKRVDIATRPELWPKLWPEVFAANPDTIPMSWYLYPNRSTVMDEYKEKWIKTVLPSGKYKDDPVYGWKADIKNKELHSITFNTGYTIYFKTYNQSVQDLQAGTAFAIDTDEELPVSLMPELQARLFGTDGQFSMAFTATLGQDTWRRTIEEIGTSKELYKDAWKRSISVFECLEYVDGSSTPWNETRIEKNIRACVSKAEVLRRIHGRFVQDTGLKYPQFNRQKHIVPAPRTVNGEKFKGVPKGWTCYSGVDWGSGGEKNHPSSIIFLSVSPNFDKVRCFKAKRYDKIETTQADLYTLYCDERGKLKPAKQAYDWAAKDFGIIQSRCGDYFTKANKDHAQGEGIVRSLLKSNILKFYDSPEIDKLAEEFEGLSEEGNKRHQKDDLVDALRYAVMAIPIDWSKILDREFSLYNDNPNEVKLTETDKRYIEARPFSQMAMGITNEDTDEEIEYWNDLY